MFGDQPWPCGEGDGSGSGETVLIGSGDDRGFSGAPGLNKAMGEAIVSMVDRCNDLGGINGRTVEVEVYDAAIFDVNSAMLDACENVFMLVGEGFAVDQFGEETRVTCDLAHIPAWTVSAPAANGPNMIQPIPNPADQLPIQSAVWIASEFPDAITNSASMFGNFSATIETKDKVLAAYPPLGYDFTLNLEYNVNGEDDWTPFVLQLKEAGITHVYFTGSCLPNYQAFRAAAAVNDFEALYTTDANFYESPCREANDGVLDGTYIRVAVLPFEEREFSAGIDDYLTISEEDGNDVSSVAAQTVSAFLLWATAATTCGSDFTVECILAEARAIDVWTGHGLHVPTDPGDNQAPTCGAVLLLEGDEYKRVWPTEPATFDCDDSYRAEIETEASVAAALDADRISQQYSG